jgi:hypothetical protein
MVLDLIDAGGVQRVSSLVDIHRPVIADYMAESQLRKTF